MQRAQMLNHPPPDRVANHLNSVPMKPILAFLCYRLHTGSSYLHRYTLSAGRAVRGIVTAPGDGFDHCRKGLANRC